MSVSGEGTIYMPSGQWSLYCRDAYSRDICVRVTGSIASGAIGTGFFSARGFVRAAVAKSSAAEGTKLTSMMGGGEL